MSRIYACVTVDTESDSGPGWKPREKASFEAVTKGIPDILSPLFKKYGVRPVYFVSPSVARNSKCAEVLKREVGRGAEIGNHLHHEEMLEERSEGLNGFACYELLDPAEKVRIKEHHELIEKNIGVTPVSYRAGRFGADIDTVRSLSELGYKVDSSVTPRISWTDRQGPDFRSFPDQPYFVALDEEAFDKISVSGGQVLEVPVTIGEKRLFFLPDKWFLHSWLRPSFMSSFEMKGLTRAFLRKYSGNDIIVLCMMFHNVEVIPGASPFAATKKQAAALVERLESALSYMAAKGVQFRTLEQIYDEYTKVRFA